MYDAVIIGAGLTGATLAERLSAYNKKVLIIEKRAHIGGNVWDEENESGIMIQKYGPHIFHTNSESVWNYLSQFTEWYAYTHRVLASIGGEMIPLPFNLSSIEKCFPEEIAQKIITKLIEYFGQGKKIPILKLRSVADHELGMLADYVYKNVFENYTKKQWDLLPEQLSEGVTSRVPILVSRDDRYFQDTYQGIPLHGYSAMVRKMLTNPNIDLQLNTDWKDIKSDIEARNIFFTGPIDEYFEYKYGALPYRSLEFEMKTLPMARYQDAAVVNFPNDHDYTRITEYKWFTGQISESTTIAKEYPREHIPDETIPYYPIPTDDNELLIKKYVSAAEQIKDKVHFLGRLGEYRYYNMDQAVARALMISDRLIERNQI
jgi:UDP-galactopyranose mutase